MPKNLLNTSDKSSFIVNLNMDKYRAVCVRFLLAVLWLTGIAQAINELTMSSLTDIDTQANVGGFGAVLAYFLLSVRSVSTVFTFIGVLALIWMLIGIVRLQFPKSCIPLYCILACSLAWGVVSLCHSFDTNCSLLGYPLRDEGLLSLLLYAVAFYLGSMLRRPENRTRFFNGIIVFGIAQVFWGFLQAQPFFPFPSSYRNIEPIMLNELRLPSGFTDSPITYAMLLAMLIAVSVPASFMAGRKLHRVLAVVCAAGSIIMSFKTQTIAGVIAGTAGFLLTVICTILFRKQTAGKKWIMPLTAFCAVCTSLVWVWFSPAVNGTYQRSNDEKLGNGFCLCDGGIVWDDSYYRIFTTGPYVPSQPHDFDINDAAGVMKYCWSEGVRVIGKYPALGTGPDNFHFTQLHSSMEILTNPNSIDRPYNDFLYIGATRGIPALIMHLILLGWCVFLAWRRRKNAYGWQLTAAAAGAVMYSLTAFVGISVLTVAPLFWMLLGIAASETIVEESPKKKERAPKQKKKTSASES